MKNKLSELKEAALPLISYLEQNYHPHTKVILSSNSIELLEELMGIPNIQETESIKPETPIYQNEVQKEFNALLHEFIFATISKDTEQELNYRIKKLLQHHGLEDIQFSVHCKNNKLVIDPLRTIDKWALSGIFSGQQMYHP